MILLCLYARPFLLLRFWLDRTTSPKRWLSDIKIQLPLVFCYIHILWCRSQRRSLHLEGWLLLFIPVSEGLFISRFLSGIFFLPNAAMASDIRRLTSSSSSSSEFGTTVPRNTKSLTRSTSSTTTWSLQDMILHLAIHHNCAFRMVI